MKASEEVSDPPGLTPYAEAMEPWCQTLEGLTPYRIQLAAATEDRLLWTQVWGKLKAKPPIALESGRPPT